MAPQPGVESADAGSKSSSWTEMSGDWESLTAVSGDFPIGSAREGSRFFYQQGAVAEAVLEQTVQPHNVPDADCCPVRPSPVSAQAKLVLTAHEVYLPKPKLAVEGPE